MKHEELETPCKALLYCDLFLGTLDDLVEEEGEIPYKEYATKLSEAGKRAREYKYLFDTLSSLCSALEFKYDMGVRLRKAYKSGYKAIIGQICAELDITILRIDEFYKNFRGLWYRENKTFGFEVQDARFGGLKQRLASCKERLEDYISGKIDRIEELEKEILPYRDKPTLYFNIYRQLISVSEI